MTIEEKFNFDRHNGEEIEGMERNNAYYLSINNDNSQTVLFDNGNQYNINSEGKIIERIDAEDELFIDRQIIRVLNNFINCNSLLTKDYDYSNSNYDGCIEIYGTTKDKKKERSILIRIVINREAKIISIPNIMIPFELKHNGFGKKIMLEIFKVVQKHSYKLYLIQMVESFYNRMVKRGAEIIMPLDVVEITKNTDLNS
jgi:hypothetical protein